MTGRETRHLLSVASVLGHHFAEGLQDFDAEFLLVLLQQLFRVLDQPEWGGGVGGEHTSHHCSTSASRTTLPATDCHSPGNERTRVKDSRVRRAWGTLREGSWPRRGAAATPAGRRQHAGSGGRAGHTPRGECREGRDRRPLAPARFCRAAVRGQLVTWLERASGAKHRVRMAAEAGTDCPLSHSLVLEEP